MRTLLAATMDPVLVNYLVAVIDMLAPTLVLPAALGETLAALLDKVDLAWSTRYTELGPDARLC